MKKHIILLLTLLCQMLGVAAEDKVYISDFSIKAGETKRIELCFDTERTDVTRLQGTVTMPEGLTVVNQSSTAGLSTWMTGNINRTGGATVTYNPANGIVQMTYGKFTAGTGAVGYIDVKASTSLAETSTINIKDFKVKKSDGTYVNVASDNCTVTREASGQGGGQSGEATFAFSQESITLDKGQTASVDVTMTNSVALTGMQATLTASDGLTITGVTKSSRIVGQFRYNTESGLVMHFGSINDNEGTVFTVGLKVDDDFTGSSATLNISNLVVTTSGAKRISASDITLNVVLPVLELTLDEVTDNSQTLADNNGKQANVTLKRTLQTGSYNTFAVPFSMAKPEGWTVKELSSESFADGLLTLNFTDAASIEAGKPYLVKVGANTNLSASAFTDVTISKDAVPFTSTNVDFIPTLGATTIGSEGDDAKTVLFLGAGNKLYNPEQLPADMKGFRAYFLLKVGAGARAFRLDFGDGETTGIREMEDGKWKMENGSYDLQGRRVESSIFNSQSSILKKGVYIVNGKKRVVK